MYRRCQSKHTIAPSMDISVSSNFERYLFYLADEESNTLASWMRVFEATGDLSVPYSLLNKARNDFSSHCANRSEIITTMRDFYQKENYLLCPHSATAVAGMRFLDLDGSNTVCLCTAHPAKFKDAVDLALVNCCSQPDPPAILEGLKNLPVRTHHMDAKYEDVKAFIQKRALVDTEDRELYFLSLGVAAIALIAIFSLRGRK
jgi:threonine synthase